MTIVRTVRITWKERIGSTWWISKKKLASTETPTILSRTPRESGNIIKVREQLVVKRVEWMMV